MQVLRLAALAQDDIEGGALGSSNFLQVVVMRKKGPGLKAS
jgi:hypothetical protein